MTSDHGHIYPCLRCSEMVGAIWIVVHPLNFCHFEKYFFFKKINFEKFRILAFRKCKKISCFILKIFLIFWVKVKHFYRAFSICLLFFCPALWIVVPCWVTNLMTFWPLSAIIRLFGCYQPLSAVICHYLPLSAVISRYQPLSAVISRYQSLSAVI